MASNEWLETLSSDELTNLVVLARKEVEPALAFLGEAEAILMQRAWEEHAGRRLQRDMFAAMPDATGQKEATNAVA